MRVSGNTRINGMLYGNRNHLEVAAIPVTDFQI